MKYEDIQVGKTYQNSAIKTCQWTVLFKDNMGLLRSLDGKREYLHRATVAHEMWEEVPEKKKVYCGLWTQKGGFTWPMSTLSIEDFNKIKRYYTEFGYSLIKEWELEYEEPSKTS